MDAIRSFYFLRKWAAIQSAVMDHAPRLTANVDRVIHVTLSEADWQAFMASTPRPVDWLKERIQEAIVKSQQPPASSRQS